MSYVKVAKITSEELENQANRIIQEIEGKGHRILTIKFFPTGDAYTYDVVFICTEQPHPHRKPFERHDTPASVKVTHL